MTTMQPQQQYDVPVGRPADTPWSGWAAFAAVMLGMLGVFHGIAGLVALFKDEYFLVGKSGLVVEVDYTAWGWAHLALGAVLLLAGLSLASGRMYGRIVGVLVAVISAVVNLAFLAAYPVWSVMVIAIDVLVVYAIIVHGRELQT